MLRNFLILPAVIGILQTLKVEGRCHFEQIQSLVNLNETAPAGSLLFNLTKDASDNVTFDVSSKHDRETNLKPQYHDKLKQCFILTDGDTWFALTSNKTLDLEYFYEEWENAVLDSIYLDFHCGAGNPIEVTIRNDPVNENKPVFNQSPYSTSVHELTKNGTEIYSLTEKVTDKDIPKASKFYFQLQPYNIQQLDGRGYFDMPQSTGKVTVRTTLDYDTMDRHYFMLNISVADSAVQNNALTAYTTLNITVLDDADQKPEFVKPGCTSPCPVPEYQAIIGITDTVFVKGPLQVEPAIQAIDRDTLNTSLIYSILSGNQHTLFHLNSRTGIITQQTSVLEAGLSDDEFRLVIEVAKQNHPDLRAFAIVRVRVRERIPSYNGTIPTMPPVTVAESPPDKEKSDGLLVPVIILGILLFIIIVAIIIVVIFFRRKHKQTTVSPGDTKSEPHTEEEELPPDMENQYNEQAKSQERLVPTGTSGSMLYAEAPSVRAGILPPLPSRDFATETEDVTKKKRSRRRKKQKEPEIFDGTKEYNMGADPEFFDSTDKSKVKRSTRSYPKETDPQLRLKVPNDEPQNE